jgi:DNA-binding response OmpR family regulator
VPRILVVDDERKVLHGLERGLQAEGYEVAGAATAEVGLELALVRP